MLDHLPVAGAIKHGPSYIYRLWKGLLDQWISTAGTVYVVSPLFDAKRVADILLLLVKHKVRRGGAGRGGAGRGWGGAGQTGGSRVGVPGQGQSQT